MEKVVKDICNFNLPNVRFTVFTNNHNKSNVSSLDYVDNIPVFRAASKLILKSQPIISDYTDLKTFIEKSDIVHHHFPFPTMELHLLRNRNLLKTKKFIITYHANPSFSRWKVLNIFYKKLYCNLLKRADLIVFTSDTVRKYSKLDESIIGQSVVVPLTHLNQFPELIKPVNERHGLIAIGKLRKYKGFDVLIKAMPKIETTLKIIGSGEEEKTLKNLVSTLNLNNKVLFENNLNDEQVMSELSKSKIFILPSINEAEAFGLVQLEALSLGIPVINTKLKSGVPEVSINDESGFTVKPNCPDSIASKINTLLKNEDLYSKFSENALKRSMKFNPDIVSKYYIKLYQ